MNMKAAALVAVAALCACHGREPEEIATEVPVDVSVAPAATDTIRAVITATGTVEPGPGADWTIIAPGPARIAQMPRTEGDAVRKGDVLVRFDAPTLRTEASSRAAEAAQAKAGLENARASHERLALLLGKGIAARRDVEAAEKELRAAEAALDGARAASANAAELLSRTLVRARFDGIVARRFHNPGDTVDGAAGDPVLRVIDPRRLQIVAAVPARDLGRIVVGHAVSVTSPAAAPDAEDAAQGRVLGLPIAVDPATGTAGVRMSAPEGLAAGTTVQVAIVAEEHSNVIVVPSEAVVTEDGKSTVFVVEKDGKAHRREVVPGIVTDKTTEIAKGLRAGEQVVVRGQEGLPDGAAVTIEAEAEAEPEPEPAPQ